MTTNLAWILSSFAITALVAFVLWTTGRASAASSPKRRRLIAIARRIGVGTRCAGVLVELALERLAVDAVASAGAAATSAMRTRKLRTATWALAAVVSLAITIAFVSRADWS